MIRIMSSKRYFFLPREEEVILWIPIVGIAVALVQWIWFPHAMEGMNPALTRFIVNVFLLNGIHLGFPFIMLAAIPEGRALVRKKIVSLGTSTFFFVCGTIVATLLVIVFLDFRVMPLPSPIDQIVSIGMLWTWALIPTFHGMRQSGGLSLMMNRTLKAGFNTDIEKQRFLRFEKRERICLNGVYLGVLGGLAVLTLDEHSSGVMLAIFSLFAIFSAFALLFLIHREPSFKNTGKLMFAVRMVFWPCGLYSTLATWLLPVMHGEEYLGFFNRVVGEKAKAVRRRALVWLLSSVVVILLSCFLNLYVDVLHISKTDIFEWQPLALILFAFQPFLTLMHYLTDGLIYKMGDKDVRSTMGQMLTGFAGEVTVSAPSIEARGEAS
jgi:hypothetical protein